MQKENLKQLLTYSINGVCTTLVNYIIYGLLLSLHTHYLIANSIAWIGAVIFAYYTNRKFVFHSTQSIKKEVLSFFSLRFVTLLVENGLLFISIQIFHLHPLAAKCFVSLITILSNYTICKHRIFTKGVIQNG